MFVSTVALACAAMGASFVPVRAGAPVSRPANALTLTLASKSTAGGNVVQGSVTLPAPAPVGGSTVTLSSPSLALAGFVVPTLGSQSAAASLTLTVRAGLSSADFSVRTFGVAQPTTVALRAASSVGSASVDLTLTPARVKTIVIAPVSVTGGQAATATIALDGRTGSSAVMSFSVGGPLNPPPPMALAPDAAIVSLPLATTLVSAVTTGTLAASLNGMLSSTGSVLVLPPIPTAIQIAPQSVFGGNQASATIVLSGKASGTGVSVSLTSSSTAVTLPSTVVIPAGADRASVALQTLTVSAAQSVTIAASPIREAAPRTGGTTTSIADGTSNTITLAEPIPDGKVSAQLSVAPLPQLQTLSATPPTVTGGDSAQLLMTWSATAIPLFSVGQTTQPTATAQLTTNHPELVTLPGGVSLSGGSPTVVRLATAQTTVDQTVSITATLASQSVSTSIVVKKPIPPLASLALSRGTVKGDDSVNVVFTLDPTAPTPIVVTLSTDHPEIVHLPPTVTIAASASPTSLTVTTSKPARHTTVTISASSRGQTKSVTLDAAP